MNKVSAPFTIIVNSCDGFEDCWLPFFYLLKKNWPGCDYPIILNTEFKDFSYPGLNIKASKANYGSGEKMAWSALLIKAIKQVETPLILYMQEDYFLEQPVNIPAIEGFASLMLQRPDIRFIGLTDFGNRPPFKPFEKMDDLWEVAQNSRYRISTQAGLWQKETLLSYLEPDENGWMFEIFGTKRAHKRKELFLTANRNTYNRTEGAIMDYVFTGIIKGKWHEAIPALFARNNLAMDFNKRGFYRKKPYLLRRFETAKTLLADPQVFFKRIRGKI